MDDLISGFEIAFGYLSDEIGDMDFNGTSADARVIFTAKAAFCFIDGLFGCIAESDLFEVFITHIRRLGRHRILFQGHIRHLYETFFLGFCGFSRKIRFYGRRMAADLAAEPLDNACKASERFTRSVGAFVHALRVQVRGCAPYFVLLF